MGGVLGCVLEWRGLYGVKAEANACFSVRLGPPSGEAPQASRGEVSPHPQLQA